MTGEEPIIRDHVSNFSDEDWEHDVHESGEPSNQSTTIRYKTSTSIEDGEDEFSKDMMQSYPSRALDRRLQEDWARDAREGPKILMSPRTHLLLEVASPLSLPSPFCYYSSSKKNRNPLMKKILGLQAPMELTSGYEMRKPQFEANLLAMRSKFPRAAIWLDQIP
ncbi:hypothetical protein HKD37_19G053314 [Glycine soja]